MTKYVWTVWEFEVLRAIFTEWHSAEHLVTFYQNRFRDSRVGGWNDEKFIAKYIFRKKFPFDEMPEL